VCLEVLEMRKILFATVSILLVSACVHAEASPSKVIVRVILVDKDLNQKPVPHIAIVLTSDSSNPSPPQEVKTDFAGNAEFQAPPGKYRLATPAGVDYQGRNFIWDMEINVSAGACIVDLSNDNARIADSLPVEDSRKVDDLTQMFKKYQNSAVTVWSEIGSGTGFIADSAGLVMTNQHVIGPSELISIQFDARTKVAAKVLAVDPERDVAVLYADLSAFPAAIPAPIAGAHAGRELAVEGERVFTIGSPLGLKKIITSGIVSKVEAHAIISDVNVNHGNSGGPLFNSQGLVIGITTFLLPTPNGPSISGVIRIDHALPMLAVARKKMKDVPLPSARLLPVEPIDPYPLSALKEVMKSTRIDRRPYVLTMGGFDVGLITPVLKYKLQEEVDVTAQSEKGRRTRHSHESERADFEPLQDMHEWDEYTGEFKPILLIQAAPQLREPLMSTLARQAVSSTGYYTPAAHLKFKADFYRMKLFCGAKEVEPIQPGKIATLANTHTAFVNVTDATYIGIYSYPPDAISTSCGRVRLELYSEKQPNHPEIKELDEKTVLRISRDFQPYFASQKDAAASQ
jgi:S1-C subfamily serine protease